MEQKLRAIDLYAGAGGWSFGLKAAGIDVVASYEWWGAAVETHNRNLGRNGKPIDVRGLSSSDLPDNVDIVVGSPPCTTFSYSNRGGSGDVSEGLIDLIKFLEIVEHIRPKYWALENVPRVAKVLSDGLENPGSPLFRFRRLIREVEVIDFSCFGVPQSRRRCIAGKFPRALLQEYSEHLPKRTLGQVIERLSAPKEVRDPVWGFVVEAKDISDIEAERGLNTEELRMNREAKTYHPVYNDMAFPDVLTAPSRTITATCTRVSRESIIVKSNSGFRRLSLRERASLQGFPVTYEFFGKSFSDKAKLIGNAIPPYFTFLFGQSLKGVPPCQLELEIGLDAAKPASGKKPQKTPPASEGRSYSEKRQFRAAIPGLRFKSGMRFDFSNQGASQSDWRVRFFFGPSVGFREIVLDQDLLNELHGSPMVRRMSMSLGSEFAELEANFNRSSPDKLQQVWTRRSSGQSPFDFVDGIGVISSSVQANLQSAPPDSQHAVIGYVLEAAARSNPNDSIPSAKKLTDNALSVFSGLYVGAWFNTLPWHGEAVQTELSA